MLVRPRSSRARRRLAAQLKALEQQNKKATPQYGKLKLEHASALHRRLKEVGCDLTDAELRGPAAEPRSCPLELILLRTSRGRRPHSDVANMSRNGARTAAEEELAEWRGPSRGRVAAPPPGATWIFRDGSR